ncbi:uncharacterized protein ACBT57_023014 isoform 3-T4 [Dama dama]
MQNQGSEMSIEDAFHGIAILSLSIAMEYLCKYSGYFSAITYNFQCASLVILVTSMVIQRTQDMVVTNRLPTVFLHSMWTPSRAVSIRASLELRLECYWDFQLFGHT